MHAGRVQLGLAGRLQRCSPGYCGWHVNQFASMLVGSMCDALGYGRRWDGNQGLVLCGVCRAGQQSG